MPWSVILIQPGAILGHQNIILLRRRGLTMANTRRTSGNAHMHKAIRFRQGPTLEEPFLLIALGKGVDSDENCQ